jgi:hypothetical protein
MRRKSAINTEKRLAMLARARRMAPEKRLEASVNLSYLLKEIERAGKRYRKEAARKGIS